MTNNALMVLSQHPVVKHGTEVVEYAPGLYEDDIPDEAEVIEEYEDVKAEADALELRYGADKERCDNVINKLNDVHKDILIEINVLHAKLMEHQMNLEDSDDLEDKENAKDLKKKMGESFEEDTEHETSDNEHDADVADALDRLNKKLLAKRCKAVYKAIARVTHPDRCRNKSEEEKKALHQKFLEAKACMSLFDLDGLERIHDELYGKTSDSINLVERLIAARQKRELYRQKMAELQGSQEWQLFCVAMRYGLSAASDQYRMGLEQALSGLRQMVSDLENPQPDTYTHWV